MVLGGCACSVDNAKKEVSGPASVAIVAPFPPRKGGVTAQAALLELYLSRMGIGVVRIDTNLLSLRRRGFRALRLLLQPGSIAAQMIMRRRLYRVAHFMAASYWGFMPAVVGVPLCRLMRKRSVVSYLGGWGPRFIDRCGWIARPIFKMADLTTVCSTVLHEEFERRGVACELVNNTYESELFGPAERDGSGTRLVWNRCFEDTYDPMMALRAFELVQARHPEASMVMTSEGSMLPMVGDYVRDHNLMGVSLPGRVSKEEVAAALQQADVCINTSRLDGLPTALLEAAGTGLPIVTTPVGGIPSVFKDGESAIMVPSEDYAAMAAAVIELFEDRPRACKIGDAAREVALSHSWERLRDVWLKAYGFRAEQGED